MKQKIISALFLSGTMLVSNFAFAESVPETATTTTVTESVAAATEESEPTKWEKVLEKLPKLSGYLQVLSDAEPTSVGGALPGEDFYYGA